MFDPLALGLRTGEDPFDLSFGMCKMHSSSRALSLSQQRRKQELAGSCCVESEKQPGILATLCPKAGNIEGNSPKARYRWLMGIRMGVLPRTPKGSKKWNPPKMSPLLH